MALARALVPRPRLLFADEPTGNLDGTTGRQVIDLLFGLGARSQATLVLVTHDENLARRCQRIVRMADGRIASDGKMADAKIGDGRTGDGRIGESKAGEPHVGAGVPA